jgi:hypothetical protein
MCPQPLKQLRTVPTAQGVEPVNAAEPAFQMNPRPKSPSAVHATKLGRGEAMILFALMTADPLVPSNKSKYSISQCAKLELF